MDYWGGGGGGGAKQALRDPTIVLSLDSGKNTYLFGPCGGFLNHPWIITSQIKPVMKQRPVHYENSSIQIYKKKFHL